MQLVDPKMAQAFRLLDTEKKILEAVAPFPHETRLRILECVCILHRLDEQAAELRRMREHYEHLKLRGRFR